MKQKRIIIDAPLKLLKDQSMFEMVASLCRYYQDNDEACRYIMDCGYKADVTVTIREVRIRVTKNVSGRPKVVRSESEHTTGDKGRKK